MLVYYSRLDQMQGILLYAQNAIAMHRKQENTFPIHYICEMTTNVKSFSRSFVGDNVVVLMSWWRRLRLTGEDKSWWNHAVHVEGEIGAHELRNGWHLWWGADTILSISTTASISTVVVMIVSVTSAIASVILLVAFSSRFGTIVATHIGLHTTTDSFRGYALANLDVRLFDDHATFDRLSTTTSILCSQHPFTISVSQLVNWDDADAGLVVAAITWAKSYSPTGLQL